MSVNTTSTLIPGSCNTVIASSALTASNTDGKASLKAARKGIREARTETRAALDDRNFQQAELNRALDGLVRAEVIETRAKAALFAQTVGQLTPAERLQLLDWLEKRGRRR